MRYSARAGNRKHAGLVEDAAICSKNIYLIIGKMLKEAREGRAGTNGLYHLITELSQHHHRQEMIIKDMQLLMARQPETHLRNNDVIQKLLERIETLEAMVQEALKR